MACTVMLTSLTRDRKWAMASNGKVMVESYLCCCLTTGPRESQEVPADGTEEDTELSSDLKSLMQQVVLPVPFQVQSSLATTRNIVPSETCAKFRRRHKVLSVVSRPSVEPPIDACSSLASTPAVDLNRNKHGTPFREAIMISLSHAYMSFPTAEYPSFLPPPPTTFTDCSLIGILQKFYPNDD